MTGLGSIPAGLFYSRGENYQEKFFAADRNAPTLDDYYKTSRV
jgi:hypothetical protein